MKIALVFHPGQANGRTIHLHRLPFVIGRAPTCHLRPSHLTVSKQHCALEAVDGLLVLRDLGSTNGTTINGRLLREGTLQLRDGDHIGFGALEFIVRLTQGHPALHQPPGNATTNGEAAEDGLMSQQTAESSRQEASPTADTHEGSALSAGEEGVAEFLLDEAPQEDAPETDSSGNGTAAPSATVSAADRMLREHLHLKPPSKKRQGALP